MRSYLGLSGVLAGALFLLAGCGGGASMTSAPLVPAPNHAASGGSPNVDPSDTANDWTKFRYDVSGSGYNQLQTTITKANVATLAPKWIFVGHVGTYSAAAVANGTVYHGEIGGYFSALNEATGAQEWTFSPVEAASFVASPLYFNGSVYAPSATGRFYVLDPATGSMKFEYPEPPIWGSYQGNVNGTYHSSPVQENGTIYIGASNKFEPNPCLPGGQLQALSPFGPTQIAMQSLTPDGSTGVGVWSTPVFDASGDMYVATGNTCSFNSGPYGDSMLRVSPSNLSVLWHSQGAPDAHDWDFGATPVIIGNMIVDGSKDGNVYAYDTQTSSLEWTANLGALSGGAIIAPAATDGTHIVIGIGSLANPAQAAIVVLDTHGNVLWSLTTAVPAGYPDHGVVSAPAISQGIVYIGYTKANCSSNCDGISAFDITNGKELWRYATPSPVLGGIVVVNGGVFAGDIGDGNFYCFTPAGSATAARLRKPTIVTGWGPARAAIFPDKWVHYGTPPNESASDKD